MSTIGELDPAIKTVKLEESEQSQQAPIGVAPTESSQTGVVNDHQKGLIAAGTEMTSANSESLPYNGKQEPLTNNEAPVEQQNLSKAGSDRNYSNAKAPKRFGRQRPGTLEPRSPKLGAHEVAAQKQQESSGTASSSKSVDVRNMHQEVEEAQKSSGQDQQKSNQFSGTSSGFHRIHGAEGFQQYLRETQSGNSMKIDSRGQSDLRSSVRNNRPRHMSTSGQHDAQFLQKFGLTNNDLNQSYGSAQEYRRTLAQAHLNSNNWIGPDEYFQRLYFLYLAHRFGVSTPSHNQSFNGFGSSTGGSSSQFASSSTYGYSHPPTQHQQRARASQQNTTFNSFTRGGRNNRLNISDLAQPHPNNGQYQHFKSHHSAQKQRVPDTHQPNLNQTAPHFGHMTHDVIVLDDKPYVPPQKINVVLKEMTSAMRQEALGFTHRRAVDLASSDYRAHQVYTTWNMMIHADVKYATECCHALICMLKEDPVNGQELAASVVRRLDLQDYDFSKVFAFPSSSAN